MKMQFVSIRRLTECPVCARTETHKETNRMSIYVCDRCDHYRDNDLIEAFDVNEGLVCEHCIEDHEIPEIADVEAWHQENFA